MVKAVRLKKRSLRQEDHRFLVEGSQTVLQALTSGTNVSAVFFTAGLETRLANVLRAAEAVHVQAEPVSPGVMAHLTSTVTPQGMIAVAQFIDVPLSAVPERAGCVPVLMEVRDPGNAGTIVRSADASGAPAVVFTRSSVDVYNPKAVRATAGSLFHVPIVRDAEAADVVGALRGRGFAILAASPHGRASIYDADFARPTAVLFGNEARGLGAGAAELADQTVRIPIAGRAESLNLAAAATLILFEAARPRADRA